MKSDLIWDYGSEYMREYSCSTPVEVEISAIAACVAALLPLSPNDRSRVLRYLDSRFGAAE